MTSLAGIMYHSFGNMKLLPRNNADAPGFSGANCVNGLGGTDGLEDLLGNSLMTVYPNPAKELVTLRYEMERPLDAEVVLLDMMGRTIASQALRGTSGEVSFRTSSLPRGTYLVSIQTERELVSRHKVILID